MPPLSMSWADLTLTELLLAIPGPSLQAGEEEDDQPGLTVRLDSGPSLLGG